MPWLHPYFCACLQNSNFSNDYTFLDWYRSDKIRVILRPLVNNSIPTRIVVLGFLLSLPKELEGMLVGKQWNPLPSGLHWIWQWTVTEIQDLTCILGQLGYPDLPIPLQLEVAIPSWIVAIEWIHSGQMTLDMSGPKICWTDQCLHITRRAKSLLERSLRR